MTLEDYIVALNRIQGLLDGSDTIQLGSDKIAEVERNLERAA